MDDHNYQSGVHAQLARQECSFALSDLPQQHREKAIERCAKIWIPIVMDALVRGVVNAVLSRGSLLLRQCRLGIVEVGTTTAPFPTPGDCLTTIRRFR